MVQERTLLFGRKKETVGPNGHTERMTGGLESWITTNVFNAAGTITEATLQTVCETTFRYGAKTKFVIGSRRFATQLDSIAMGRLQTVPRAEVYGVAVKEFVTSHGTLMVAISDTLERDYAGYAFFVDMEHVFKRFIRDDKGGREARLNTNIQGNAVDGWEDEYLSEIGLHVTNQATCAVLKGF
jgi:hypothetical protein